MQAIFGFESRETFWSCVASLCIKQHGGSGYNFTRADVLDMEADEIVWYLEEIRRRRTEESQRLAEAAAAAKAGTSAP